MTFWAIDTDSEGQVRTPDLPSMTQKGLLRGQGRYSTLESGDALSGSTVKVSTVAGRVSSHRTRHPVTGLATLHQRAVAARDHLVPSRLAGGLTRGWPPTSGVTLKGGRHENCGSLSTGQ